MCYPCTMCNGCGKLDQELFQYMIPKLVCLACGSDLPSDIDSCPNCGAPKPPQPGQAQKSLHQASN